MKHRALASLFAVVGCVDVAGPFTHRAEPIVARAKSAAERAERARIAALPLLPEELRGRARVIDREGPVQRLLAGALRVEMRGAATTTAEDVPSQPIASAMSGARGWVFATFDGDLYASATFTGRLRALRSLGCTRPPQQEQNPGFAIHFGGVMPQLRDLPTFEVFQSFGRVAFMNEQREILWSDGASMRTLDLANAVGLAWTSETRGAVIVGYETLKTTRDGGRTWRDVDLGGALPVSVSGGIDGLFVLTSEGLRRIDDRDALTPATSNNEEPLHEQGLWPTNVFARGYDVVSPPARLRCSPRDDRWEGPGFVAHLPTRRGRYDTLDLAIPRGASAPFGTPRGRAFASNEMVPAAVSVTRPDNPSPGHPVTLSARGEDDRGAFTVRVATTAPREIPVTAPWKVVAVTRAGVLCTIDLRAESDSEAVKSLYWFTASGARRVEVSLSSDARVNAVGLADGGVAVVARTAIERSSRQWRARGASTSVHCAALLTADGAVSGRRCVVTDGIARELIGLAQDGDRWGLVTAEGVTPGALTFRTLDGATTSLGEWSFAETPALCGDAVGTTRMHLFGASSESNDDERYSIRIGPQFDGPDFAETRLVTVERSPRGGAACVRRVWCTQRLEGIDLGDGEYIDGLWGAFRLNARGGRLVGTLDDARRIATTPVTLDQDAPLPDM